MQCFRRMSERGVLDVLRTSESKEVLRLAVHRGPQQKTGEKGGLARISHHLATAGADMAAMAALLGARGLRRTAESTTRPLTPANDHPDYHLGPLATRLGKTCGLAGNRS